jgi:hypothetical protein
MARAAPRRDDDWSAEERSGVPRAQGCHAARAWPPGELPFCCYMWSGTACTGRTTSCTIAGGHPVCIGHRAVPSGSSSTQRRPPPRGIWRATSTSVSPATTCALRKGRSAAEYRYTTSHYGVSPRPLEGGTTGPQLKSMWPPSSTSSLKSRGGMAGNPGKTCRLRQVPQLTSLCDTPPHVYLVTVRIPLLTPCRKNTNSLANYAVECIGA